MKNHPPYSLRLRSNGIYYSVHRITRKRESLGTPDLSEAYERLNVMNEGATSSYHALKKAKHWLKMAGYGDMQETWQEAMAACESRPGLDPVTSHRLASAFRSHHFDALRSLRICDTKPEVFDPLLACGKPSIIKNLRTLHNFALTKRWLLEPLAPPNAFKVVRRKATRAITEEEHLSLMEAAKSEERRDYYQFLWLTGGAQSDGAALRAENFDPAARKLQFTRAKTSNVCKLEFHECVFALLDRLPQRGFLFPKIVTESQSQRAAVFRRACESLKISGITLHSYRYAFAERCQLAGISEAEAMAAMGLKSYSVYRTYARGADLACSPVDKAIPQRIKLAAMPYDSGIRRIPRIPLRNEPRLEARKAA